MSLCKSCNKFIDHASAIVCSECSLKNVRIVNLASQTSPLGEGDSNVKQLYCCKACSEGSADWIKEIWKTENLIPLDVDKITQEIVDNMPEYFYEAGIEGDVFEKILKTNISKYWYSPLVALTDEKIEKIKTLIDSCHYWEFDTTELRERMNLHLNGICTKQVDADSLIRDIALTDIYLKKEDKICFDENKLRAILTKYFIW